MCVSFLSGIYLSEMIQLPFRCALPGYDNDTYEVQSEAHQLLINRTIPTLSDGTYDKCHLYSISGDVFSNFTNVPCNAWVYDTFTFSSTLGAKVIVYGAVFYTLTPGPEVAKLFACSTQLSTKF